MTFAPILDPSSYTSEKEPDRRRSLAAGRVLRQMAEGDAEVLREALQLIAGLGGKSVRAGPSAQESATLHKELLELLLQHQLSDVGSLQSSEVLESLAAQLRQVKAFGEMDGDKIPQYIAPVARLIRSGRIELFAG